MAEFQPYPGFCDQTYQLRSADLAVDRAINCYPSTNQIGVGKVGRGLIPRPGAQAFSSPGSGTGRALWGGENRMFAVRGDTLYEIDSVGAATSLGNIGSGTSPCTPLFNGTQVLIINPNTGVAKVWDGTTMTTAATPGGASSGAYLNGFGYIVEPDTNKIYQSGALDFSTWDPLEFDTRTIEQDRIITIIADHQNLWTIGSQTANPWYFAGSAGFALQTVPNAFIEEGTASAFSPVSCDGQIVLLGSSKRGQGRIMAFTPGRATQISTYAVERAISQYGDITTATAYSYQSEGHTFYVISFPVQGVQWVYDFTEKAWHERYGWNGSAYTMAPGYLHCSTFGQRHFIMKTTGEILEQKETLSEDLGVAFQVQRISPILGAGKRHNVHAMRVDQQAGSGSISEGATLEFSRNGGRTWDTARPELPQVDYAGLDAYLEWRLLGQATQRGFSTRVTWMSNANFVVSGASVKVTELLS